MTLRVNDCKRDGEYETDPSPVFFGVWRTALNSKVVDKLIERIYGLKFVRIIIRRRVAK